MKIHICVLMQPLQCECVVTAPYLEGSFFTTHLSSQVRLPSIAGYVSIYDNQQMPQLKTKNIFIRAINNGKIPNKQIVIYNKKMNQNEFYVDTIISTGVKMEIKEILKNFLRGNFSGERAMFFKEIFRGHFSRGDFSEASFRGLFSKTCINT